MKITSTSLFFFFFGLFIFGFSQEKSLQITFLGNSGFSMTDGELNVYLDFPYKSGAHKYMEYDAKEIEKILDIQSFYLPINTPIIIRKN